MLHQQAQYPIQPLCQLFDLPRSSYYYQALASDELGVRVALAQVVAEFPSYGSRRITEQLRRPPHNLVINRKQVQRLIVAPGLVRLVKQRKQLTTNSAHAYPRHPNLVIDLPVTHPDHVWVGDITYVRFRQDFIYLAVIMDVFTRSIRGWHLHRHLNQELTLTALRKALVNHRPEIHHSDQGVQYAAQDYVALLEYHQVQISMAEVGAAWQNGYAERLIRTIKEEEIDLSDYLTFADAYLSIGRFIEQVYQYKRIHSALGYLTPVEFETAWQQQQCGIGASLNLT
jgi:putative transposase